MGFTLSALSAWLLARSLYVRSTPGSMNVQILEHIYTYLAVLNFIC